MVSFCLNCTEKKQIVKILKLQKQKNGIMVSSNCAVCGSKKLRFIKEQEASGILNDLGITTAFISWR